jgi:UTP--glucose-1-phosphate uridylyltransferase
MDITQAIIPAAGLGTRFLPYTKAVPKELVPIMGTPAIQLVIEEGIASGIHTFEIIANRDKKAIKNYLSKNEYLNEYAQKIGKEKLIKNINSIIASTKFNFIPQNQPRGLGHAVLMAQKKIGPNYCAVLLPDEIMISNIPALKQLITIAKKYNASVIAVQEVPQESVSSYGIVAIKEKIENGLFTIDHLVEKPTQHNAPSNLAIIGRYILAPTIFNALKKVKPGSGNEIQLTDGIMAMIQSGHKVLAYKVDSIRHDIGNPLGWLQANIDCALKNKNYTAQLTNYMKTAISLQ